MAGTDLVKVTRIYTDTTLPGNPTNKGVQEDVNLQAFLGLLPTNGGAGLPTAVIQQTAPAAAPVPFADLTAAANYVNSLRTLLIAAKVLV